jgi:hypothetical protein
LLTRRAFQKGIARVCKNLVRELQRVQSRLVGVPTDEPYRRIVVQFLNVLVGRDGRFELFWNHYLKHELERQYPSFLFSYEKAKTSKLYDEVCMFSVVDRLLSLVCVTLNSECWSEFRKTCFPDSNKEKDGDPKKGRLDFAFVQVDVELMDTQVTHMNLIDFADGMALYFEGTQTAAHDTETRRRMLHMSQSKLRRFCDSFPGNFGALLRLGGVFSHMAALSSGGEKAQFEEASVATFDALLREKISYVFSQRFLVA